MPLNKSSLMEKTHSLKMRISSAQESATTTKCGGFKKKIRNVAEKKLKCVFVAKFTVTTTFQRAKMRWKQ